ncbi:MAG TPA: CRTAC1 family protein [Bacteroidales bacterium]|nr:hypothetical protein [Bacteroidales bacterium]HNR41673.1 CRTAC1 family protein [Bacteroidales bacterium]HPM17926.1 CRTAC1 family protein [Bacteroidales bacterium]
MKKIFASLAAAVIAVLLFVVFKPGEKILTYTDVTGPAGIDFRYNFGDYTYQSIIESSGSGITVFDYNNDGLMDIYMMNGTYLEGISDPAGSVFRDTPNKLYKNNGDGTFTEVGHEAGVDDRNWSMAACAIDYDNDGDEDLFLLNYGPNVFFRNNGDGTFTDITDQTGLRGPEKLNGFEKWSIGAVFFDYNGDNRLDVMVGNFLAFDPSIVSPVSREAQPHPSQYKGQASMLYEQQPDGSFRDVTKQVNLYYPDSKCMGLTVFDFDNDGVLDIFQANDHHFNYMFKSVDGKYQEIAIARGLAANSKGIGAGSMHGTIGDINGDGLPDILVSDTDYGALYLNLGNGMFQDVTHSSGIASNLAGKGTWGTALFDFDNDGDLDIFAANGNAEELILQLQLLLENDGKGHFTDVGRRHSDYFLKRRSGRGMAVCDYDNDGDLDIIVSHVDLIATPVLLRNDGGNRNNWLGLTLKSHAGLAPAISAKVTVFSGSLKQVLINQWITGYLSSNDPRLHIGLGKHKTIDSLEIAWSDGQTETYRNIRANRYITIMQGEGVVE